MDPTAVAVGIPAFTLSIPPAADQVRTARLFAAAVARHYGCDEERIEDLKLAISEACTNSIKAHVDADISDAVRIVVRRDAEWLRFDIVDAGAGIELARLTEPDVTPPPGLFEGSLGLAVIQSLFPAFEIRRNTDRGTTVSFTLEPGPA